MNYDIRIKHDKEGSGELELERLAAIAKSTKDIAQKALMLRVFGYSDLKMPPSMTDASKIFLEKFTVNSRGSHLLLDTKPIAENISHLQLDMFKPTMVDELKTLTPMALVIQAFRDALAEGEEKENLDKPLLKALKQFKRNFSSDKEVFSFSNRQSIAVINIKRTDFGKIEKLEESIPEPSKTVISGKVDELKYSKGRLVLLTEEGSVNVMVQDEKLFASLKDFFGSDCTIEGMANYKVGGKLSYVEMTGFSTPSETDKYFSKQPKGMNALQQVMFQLKQGKSKNPLNDLAGQWPGRETDEEFDEMLKSLNE